MSNAIVNLRQSLDRSIPQLERALPDGMDALRFARIAMTAIQTKPQLLQCDPRTVLGAVFEAAQKGLSLDDVLGEAYLIPRRVKGNWTAVFQIGYKGWLKLAWRSGKVAGIACEAVCENDSFDYSLGSDTWVKHMKHPTNRGHVMYAYALIRLVTGAAVLKVLTRSEIDKHREASQRSQGGPWDTHYDRMAEKTVLMEALRFSPLSTEVHRAISEYELRNVGIEPAPGQPDFRVNSRHKDVDDEPDPDFEISDRVEEPGESGAWAPNELPFEMSDRGGLYEDAGS
jgi:recombination protein RecT